MDATGGVSGTEIWIADPIKIYCSGGCIKFEVLSLQLYGGPLSPVRGLLTGGSVWIFLGLSVQLWGQSSVSFWEALGVLDGASTVHPIGPSSWAFFLAP